METKAVYLLLFIFFYEVGYAKDFQSQFDSPKVKND